MTMDADAKCRICGAEDVALVGTVEYLAGYKLPILDCANCGCRFARHDASSHDFLHVSGALSYYGEYRDLAKRCRELFSQRRLQELRDYLSRTSKYRFIIDRVSREPQSSRLLEFGCSRGYLTSCFILEGRDVVGADISSAAIECAREAFGEHFVLAGAPSIAAGCPYDVIYHVGTIGCVCDPLSLTRQLLAMLKPGGKLLFNAPNRAALHLRGQLWLDSAPPPDLVTLFPEGFWVRHFSAQAQVEESIEMLPDNNAVEIALRRLCGRHWQRPVPQTLVPGDESGHRWSQQMGPGWELFERVALKAAQLTGLAALAHKRASEFGLFVQMTTR